MLIRRCRSPLLGNVLGDFFAYLDEAEPDGEICPALLDIQIPAVARLQFVVEQGADDAVVFRDFQ